LGYDSGSTSRDRDSVSIPTFSDKVADMHMVKFVADLFKIPEEVVHDTRICKSLVSNRTQASGAMRRDPTLFISDGVFNV
jgi:hypothetical protein